jgi:hypothetical protein
MNQTAINVTAILVFMMTVSTLMGPLFNLSPAIPAIATITVLGIATLDSFSLQGRGGTLLLDWIAGFSPAHRQRIIHHEAGHFLVAHLLSISVFGYTLTAWEALKQGQPGQGGVSFNDEELLSQLEQGKITAQLLDRYCTVWMAGVAAENLVYKNTEGGADDRSKLNTVLSSLGFSASIREQKQKFFALQAKNLLQQNWQAYEILVQAMSDRLSVSECKNKITEYINIGG